MVLIEVAPVARASQRLLQHPAAAHEAALLRLARLPIDEDASLGRAFVQATRLIARTLAVERVGIWLFEDGRALLRCACLYRRSTDTHGSGDVLRPADFPAYGAALDEHRAIVADDARSHPLTRELTRTYLDPHGISSMLDAPLLRHGEVAGVVCHEHTGPRRTWTDAEVSFAASVADIVSLAMEQAAHIAARRALEEQARHVEEDHRMAALGRLAAAVGHDFGHLLTIVLAHAEGILEQPGLPGPAAAHARTVIDAIGRSRELTRQLVELGRPVEDCPEPTRLDDVVGEAADLLRSLARAGQRVEVDCAAAGARVPLDRTRLEQIVANLVGNAIDATTAGGLVRVATSIVDGDGGRYAVLRVADDGVGIDDATRPHIFEPYFTTKGGGGSGLGLAIVHALVQRAGGFVLVESVPGRGTTFAVHLPLARTR